MEEARIGQFAVGSKKGVLWTFSTECVFHGNLSKMCWNPWWYFRHFRRLMSAEKRRRKKVPAAEIRIVGYPMLHFNFPFQRQQYFRVAFNAIPTVLAMRAHWVRRPHDCCTVCSTRARVCGWRDGTCERAGPVPGAQSQPSCELQDVDPLREIEPGHRHSVVDGWRSAGFTQEGTQAAAHAEVRPRRSHIARALLPRSSRAPH